MKILKSPFFFLAVGLSLCFSSEAFAQNNYSNFKELSSRINQLQSQNRNLVSIKSLAKTNEGRDIWAITIGSGDVKNRPAIAIVGGVKGSHLLGSELAVAFAEKLMSSKNSEETKALLESTTFYILPRVNPDASEQYFSSLKYNRDGNATSTDDDRDGSFDEDGFNDLNNDGLITWMRVEDPTGKWMTHPDDARIMVEADISKGEKGMYHVFTEGIDDDKDGKFNEDGVGGVDINKNFTYDYKYFTPGAGENMADQNETRAIIDFLFDEASNVQAVFSFGPENNLSTPVTFNRAAINKRLISGWYEKDVAVNKLLSDAYNETISQKNSPKVTPEGGDFHQWAYFHYGRMSLSTPGWWTPTVKDEDGKDKKFSNEEVKFLAWSEANNLDNFVNWTEVSHPDFPNKKVEVGGIKPYVVLNPPYAMVDSIAIEHTNFIMKLAEMLPKVEILDVQTEKLGNNLTRVTAKVHNSGTLATASELGERTRWVSKVNVNVEMTNGLNLVSGQKVQLIDRIDGDESTTHTWLVRGTGTLTINAGAPSTGLSTVKQTIRN